MESAIKTFEPDIDIRSRLVAACLPSMPETLLKLMELCQSDVVGMKQLLRLVEQDPAMTAKMLSVANTSAYHRDGPAGTLEQALQTIGTGMIKIIVINESVSQVFDKISRNRAVDLRGFWAHALRAGVAAHAIALKTAYSNPAEAYLAGLLHDVGRLALLAVLPREYGFNFYSADNADLCAVEERTLQTNHAEVGSFLIEQWKLDSFIADSVLYHHEVPQRVQTSHPLIRITHLAHVLSSDVANDDLEKSGALCALSLAELLEMREQIGEQVQKAAKDLNIDLEAEIQLPASQAAMPNAAQEKIMEQARGMMLTSALERSFAQQQGESDLLETITRSARILFQFDSAIILLVNPAADALAGSGSGEHRQRLADFSLPLNREGSTIAESARTSQIMLTPPVSPSMSLLEEQLVRLLATEHLACLPLMAHGNCRGVLIGGFKAWQTGDLKKRMNFLTTFANEAGLALNAKTVQNAESEQRLLDLARDYREASRKVAHEVNNPLSIIKNYLAILDRKLLNSQAISGEVAILNEEIDRVGKIIDEFAELNISERTTAADPGKVIADVVRLFRHTEYGSASVQIENRMANKGVEIECSADTLKQIFVNLIKNAAEAMTVGGLIEIGSEGQVRREGVLYVNLWVRDNGPGIASEIMDNLFSPVQSSKGSGHSGLGLHIVYGLVKKMQGLITCKSTGQGTTFDILLPSAQRDVIERASANEVKIKNGQFLA